MAATSSVRDQAAPVMRLEEDWESIESISRILEANLPDDNYSIACQEAFSAAVQACRTGRWQPITAAKESIEKVSTCWQMSLVTRAIADHDIDSFFKLLEYKVTLHWTDSSGNTALHAAARVGAIDLIEPLCRHIDVDIENHRGLTPLHVAVECSQADLVGILIERGANAMRPVDLGRGISLNALGLAVMRGEKTCIDALIRSGRCNLRVMCPQIGHLLHIAIYFHQFDSLLHLLDNYKSQFTDLIEMRNQDDLTPLSFAASLGEVEAMGILFHHGASLEATDYHGRFPMHYAAANCHHDAIQFLASIGSKIKPEDSKQKRPLDLTREAEPRSLTASSDARSCEQLLINLHRSKAARKVCLAPKLFPPKNLVFRGGGPKGLAFMGALQALEADQMLRSIERIAGTSAGAITAALLAVNFPVDRLQLILETTDFTQFLDHPLSQTLIAESVKEATKDTSSVIKTLWHAAKTMHSLVTNRKQVYEFITSPRQLAASAIKSLYSCTGICDGEFFRKWFEDLVAEQTGINLLTFGELADLIRQGHPYKHLHVYGTKVGAVQEIVHMSSEDPDWKNVIVSDAIRISMSIPGVFKPHVVHIKSQGRRIPAPQHGSFLDGGMLYNFPVETFDQKRFLTREDIGPEGLCPKFNKHTIGFSLYSSQSTQADPSNANNVKDLLINICNVYMNAEDAIRQLNPYNKSRVIEIDVHDVGTLSFNLSSEQKQKLIQSGGQSTRTFLDNQNFTQLPTLIPPSAQELALGQSVWGKHFGNTDPVPEQPTNIDQLLRGPCPIWRHKKLYETHMLVYFPSRLGNQPLSLNRFVQTVPIDREASIFRCNEAKQIGNAEVTGPGYWGLVTRHTIPGCYKVRYKDRLALLAQYPGYNPPTPLEAAICTSLEYLENHQKLFADTALSWLRWTQTDTTIDDVPVCVGEFDENGIGIFPYPGKSIGGLIGIRRL